MLLNWERSSMEEAVLASLPDSCNLLRPTQVGDGMGGAVTTLVNIGTFPCDLIPQILRMIPQMNNVAGTLSTETRYSIDLPHTAAPQPGDYIQVTTGDIPATYKVMDVVHATESLLSRTLNQLITGAGQP